jgi:hypothetical protein
MAMTNTTEIEYITGYGSDRITGLRVRSGQAGILSIEDGRMAQRIRRSLARRGYKAHIDVMPGSVVVTRIVRAH